MKGRLSSRVRRRITGATLLALAPLLLIGSLETHLGHRAGQAEKQIFVDAHHAGQAEHFDAADTVRIVRCSDCLAPVQPLESRSLGSARLARPAPVAVAARDHAEPPAPVARRSWCPRGPPSSALS